MKLKSEQIRELIKKYIFVQKIQLNNEPKNAKE